MTFLTTIPNRIIKNALRVSLPFYLVLALFIFSTGQAQWQSIGTILQSFKTDNGYVFFEEKQKVEVSILAPDVVRVHVLPNDFKDRPDNSWAVVNTDIGDKTFKVQDMENIIVLSTSALEIRIVRTPFRITFFDKKGHVINDDDPDKGMARSGNDVAVWKKMPADEIYYGLGEKAGSMYLKGKSYSFWNSDIPAYKAETDPLYQTTPFFYGIKKGVAYGIFFDNTYYSYFNFGKENPEEYSFGATGGEINYYFIYGPKPKDVLQKFSTLIGKMPIPPKWSLGYQQCRWSYYPESRVREIAQNFRSKNIPCDVIYLDIHYMDAYKCFTWDSTRFPNPKQLTSDLAKDGFNMVTIVDPGIKQEPGYWVYDQGMRSNHFVKGPNGENFVGSVWPGKCVFPDFTKNTSRDWWGSLYKPMLDAGIRGFWNDMNEPSVFDSPNKTFDLDSKHDANGQPSDHRQNHNIFGMQMARGTYEGLLKLRPNERPFVLTRAGYTGVNRYSAIWTGDNISSWDHLVMSIPMCLGLSISGNPFIGSDIGGFIGNPSGELFARWMELGVFTPFMRAHSVIDAKNKEPWEYGAENEAINKKTIEMRYKFMPYIYTQFYNASVTGIPMMRPLVFDYPEDGNVAFREDEFLFGDGLLVAPVVHEGETQRGVYLPAGNWYDYWTGEKLEGGKDVTAKAPLDRLPLYVKAGTILPTQQVVQYTGQAPIDPLTFEIFPDTQATATLYEDDGISFDYQQKIYSLRTISIQNTATQCEITLSKPEGTYKPAKRSVVLKFNASSVKPDAVQLDKKSIKETSATTFATDTKGWYLDSNAKVLWIKFEDGFAKQMVTIK